MNILDAKVMRRKKSLLIIYANFESTLVTLDESYRNKYKKHIACSYGCKLVCVDDKFFEPF